MMISARSVMISATSVTVTRLTTDGYHVGPGPTYVGPGPTYVGPGPYADMYVINWTSGERKVDGVIHVIHFFHLGPIPDTKNSSISPLG